MPPFHRLLPSIALVLSGGLTLPSLALASRTRPDARLRRDASETFRPATVTSPPAAAAIAFKWNLSERELPLLGLPDKLSPGIDQALAYPIDQFRFPIFQTLSYDDESGNYILPVLAENHGIHFVDFEPTGVAHKYASTDGSNMQLVDNDTLKTIRTSDGGKYAFVRYPDGEFRCASIKSADGSFLNLIYTANGLVLHSVADSSGRTITFNYDRDGIRSVTQAWMADSRGMTKTWSIRAAAESFTDTAINFSRPAVLLLRKALPNNAIVRRYTEEMAASDRMLAHVFGGPSGVAAGNGFEPIGLAAQYPLYRGDIIANDGRELRGHLSFAMHLYGNSTGTGDSALYVPAGFTSHSDGPSPTDAVVTFYYPRLGDLTDVTLAVFHVANFQISSEGERVRVGNIGGLGGCSPLYKHTHIEFYRGDVRLPALAARPHLRIDPAAVFATQVAGR